MVFVLWAPAIGQSAATTLLQQPRIVLACLGARKQNFSPRRSWKRDARSNGTGEKIRSAAHRLRRARYGRTIAAGRQPREQALGAAAGSRGTSRDFGHCRRGKRGGAASRPSTSPAVGPPSFRAASAGHLKRWICPSGRRSPPTDE